MRLVKLGDICEMSSGATPRTGVEGFYNGHIPWAKIGDLETSGDSKVYETEETITDEGLKSIRNRLFDKGTLLLAMYGSVGKTAFAGTQMSANQAILGITAKDDQVYLSFLRYWFVANQENLVHGARGVALKNISATIVKNLKIPLPPLETQKKIAAILDEADKLRQLDKQLIEKYDALTQSLFLDMFGDPVANVARWEVKTLSEVCLKITDGTHHSPEPMSSGFPYVTAKHVKPFKLDFEAKPSFVSEEAHNAIYSRCNPEYGDVLYIKDGATTGIACINTFKTPISMLSSLALLKLNKRLINNQFLCHWLNHEIVKQKFISEFMSGAAIKRYTLTKIKSFKIIVPNIELQNQFAERIQAIEAQKALAQQSLEKSEELFNSLLQKAFKGELVK